MEKRVKKRSLFLKDVRRGKRTLSFQTSEDEASPIFRIVGMLIMAFLGQFSFLVGFRSLGLFLYLLGFVLVFLQGRREREGELAPFWGHVEPVYFGSLFRWLFLASVVLNLVALSFFTKLFNQSAMDIYLVSILVFWLSVFSFESKVSKNDRFSGVRDKLSSKWLFPTIISIFIFGFIMRAYDLLNIPKGSYEDEMCWVLEALYIVKAGVFAANSPFGLEGAGVSSHMIHFISAMVMRLTSWDNLVAAKSVSAVFGSLTVVAIYFMLSTMFNRRTGVLGSLLLACSYWHAIESRLAYDHVIAPFFCVMATYFLFKGLKSGRIRHFAFAGTALGFASFFYVTGRVSSVIFGIFFLYMVVYQREFLKPYFKHLIIFCIGAFVVVSPFLKSINPFGVGASSRIGYVGLLGEARAKGQNPIKAVLANAVTHLEMCNVAGVNKPRYTPQVGWPMLDFFSAIFFALGLVYALARIKDGRYFFLLVWYFFMLLPGIYSSAGEAPSSWRCSAAIPAVIAFAAVFFDRILDIFEKSAVGLFVKFSKFFLIAVTAFIVLFNVWSVFHVYSNSIGNYDEALPLETALGRIMNQKVGQYDVYSNTDRLVYVTIDELLDRHGQYKPFIMEEHIPAPWSARPAYYLLRGDKMLLEPLLRTYYPNSHWEEFKNMHGAVFIKGCAVSKEDIQSFYGIEAAYSKGTAIVKREESMVDFDWSSASTTKAPLAAPFNAVWSSRLKVPGYGQYNLGLNAKGNWKLYLDGTLLVAHTVSLKAEKVIKPVTLFKGNHDLKVVYSSPRDGVDKVQMVWGVLGNKDYLEKVVPPGSFVKAVAEKAVTGLTANVYKRQDWKGVPLHKFTAPLLYINWTENEPMPGPFSIEFNGKIRIDQAGEYVFTIGTYGEASLYLDGKIIGTSKQVFNQFPVTLTGKWHNIRVRYTYSGGGSKGLELWWLTPHSGLQLVPLDVFAPL